MTGMDCYCDCHTKAGCFLCLHDHQGKPTPPDVSRVKVQLATLARLGPPMPDEEEAS